MPTNLIEAALSDAYVRACEAVGETNVRRFFRAALKALDEGNTKPAVLLIARW